MTRPIEILLVEDNPGDVDLTREAMKDGRLANNLHVTWNGEEALDFLLRRGKYTDAPRPDLILLDLNLPKLSGRQLLAEIKEHPEVRSVPVVVLTSSVAEEDIIRSYDLHANCYVQKPVDFQRFVSIVRQIEEYWFMVVKLPSRSE